MTIKKQEQNLDFPQFLEKCYIIYSMDFEEKRRRQMIRVIIAEIGMVISVAAIVVVSTLAAMGFMISGNGGIEQSGLMQLHTLPTGASVKIDGNSIFSRTNFSRTLSAGEHYLEIFRDRYDSWEKTINVQPGVLIRLYYPRLFLQDRVTESVQELAKATGLEFYTPSPNRNYILYAESDAAEWQLIDAKSDNLKITPLDLSGIMPGMVEEVPKTKTAIETHSYKFLGKIEQMVWSSNEENVLVKTSYDGKIEWVLVRLKDISRSINLTRTFALDNAAEVKIIDGSANQLYVLEKQQLRRINTNDSVMSRVLLENIKTFQNYEANVIYVAEDKENKQQLVGVYRDDEKAGTLLAEVAAEKKISVALSSYYGDDYMVWTADDNIEVLYGRLPSYNENGADLSSLKHLMEDAKLSDIPEKLFVSPGNEFVVAKKGAKLMVTDLEMGDLQEYEAPASSVSWFDASMFYTIVDKEIIVWDFDGTNLRNLAESAKTAEDEKVKVADYPVFITSNNRWLYYLIEEDNIITLTREKIRE